MPNYRRLFVPGGAYFFTVNLHDRKRDFLIEHITDLRASWRDMKKHHPFETIAAVVLPEHMHFIWALPPGDDDFPVRMRLLKSGFTRRLPSAMKQKGLKGERGVWQKRYWEHCVRDEDDLSRHINYIHWNPVKHGYVSDPDDWPYSTWHQWKREFGRLIDIPPKGWPTDGYGEK